MDATSCDSSDGHLVAEAEAALWERWRSGRDITARELLLDMHLPYARVVAASYFARRFSAELEFSDFLQLARVGLLESVDRFNPSFGVHFRTFAARRMHGALLDGIEHMTEKQQQLAARKRIDEDRRGSIKTPTEAKAKGGGRNAEQILQYVAEAGLAFALSWLLDGTGMLHAEEKSETHPFYRSVELRELRQRVADLVRQLPTQESRVVREHYFQERRFDEIAEGMQLSKGRVSQIHKKALMHLAERMQEKRAPSVCW